MNMVNKLVKQCVFSGSTLAFAESVTCGMAVAKLAVYKGASDAFKGGITAYTPQVKNQLLGVSYKMIEKYSCESPQVTAAMIKGLKKIIQADVYAAITGLASAGGSETKEKPVGTVFYAIMYKNKIRAYKFIFKGTPLQIREKACARLYKLILKTIT